MITKTFSITTKEITAEQILNLLIMKSFVNNLPEDFCVQISEAKKL